VKSNDRNPSDALPDFSCHVLETEEITWMECIGCHHMQKEFVRHTGRKHIETSNAIRTMEAGTS
jgi:hypothetical protein